MINKIYLKIVIHTDEIQVENNYLQKPFLNVKFEFKFLEQSILNVILYLTQYIIRMLQKFSINTILGLHGTWVRQTKGPNTKSKEAPTLRFAQVQGQHL